MLKISLSALSVLAFFSFKADAIIGECSEYGRKAVACYELGHLANSYDETGFGCGNSEETNLWEVPASKNETIAIDEIDVKAYNYAGGSAVDRNCRVEFRNSQGETCSFGMFLSLGTEDGEAKISDFQCGE